MAAREYIPGLSNILTELGFPRDEASVIMEGIASNQNFNIEAYIPLPLLENEIFPFLELRDAINLQLKMLKPNQRPPTRIWLERLRQINLQTYINIMTKSDLFKRRYNPELALTKAVRQVYAQSQRNIQDADTIAILIMLGLFDDPTVVGDYVGFGMTEDNYVLYLKLSTANLQDVMDVYGKALVSSDTIFAFLFNHGVYISGHLITLIMRLEDANILNMLEEADFDLDQDDANDFSSVFFQQLMNKGYLKFVANYMRNIREQGFTIYPWIYTDIRQRLNNARDENEQIALQRIIREMPIQVGNMSEDESGTPTSSPRRRPQRRPQPRPERGPQRYFSRAFASDDSESESE